MTRLTPLLVVAGAAALVGALPAHADPPAISAKRAEAERVLAEIQSLDSRLERAVEAYNGATVQLAAIDRARAVNARQLTLARRNLSLAQQRLGARLRAIYTSDQEDSALAILLGSGSLGDFLNRLETVNSVASQDEQVLGEIRRFKRDVSTRAVRLKAAHLRQEKIVAQRRAAREQIENGLAERRRLVASIENEIARLQARERARQEQLRRQAKARIEAARAARQAQSAPEPEPDLGVSAVTPEGIAVAPDTRHAHVVPIAMRYLGIPYKWAGASPEEGFDCSGFVLYVYAQVGVSLPHNAAMQYQYGVPVAKEDLQPGDIVFFNNLGHNGIYIGNGQFIQAPKTGDVVKISSLSEPWYAAGYYGAKRLP